ncbi:hypothetical protein ACFZBU_38565 [Embleya sp. NPDC008237]|uniref:hypothetical protein n=1 Tax=Embleya sp. NPDC008237 TaxID=3363978 RepID=UPI0036E92973
MSARPEHTTPPGAHVPRTIGGVRDALDPEQRAAFEEEPAATPLGDGRLDDLVFLWWGIAALGNDPAVIADLHAAAAGTLHTHPVELDDAGPGWSGEIDPR